LRKNATIGGRARQKKDGFTFDMGPSWYWMPDVFDRFLLTLVRRQPIIMSSSSYLLLIESYFGVDEFITIADNLAEIEATFESIEEGSGAVCTNLLLSKQK
jgi:phytoene desaturase